jgi:hypothetical protein
MLQDRRDLRRVQLAITIACLDLGNLDAAVQAAVAGEMAERIDMGAGMPRRHDDLVGKARSIRPLSRMRIAVPPVQRQRRGNVLVIDRHRRRHVIRQLEDPRAVAKGRKKPRIEARQPARHVVPPVRYTPSFTTAIMSISIFRPADGPRRPS